jgi:hypothetical protein
MSQKVFTNINIFPRLMGNTRIQWEMHPYFTEQGPYTFTVQYSHSGVPMDDGDAASDWVDTSSSVVDTYVLSDSNQRIWSNADRLFYRIKVVTGAGNTYYSNPILPITNSNYHDSAIANDVIRREKLLLNRYTGTCGLLFKRRTWGEICPNSCLDYDTREVINQNCPVCFGTGFKGGYFPGILYYINSNIISRDKITREDNIGMQNVIELQGRALACPMPKTNDFWLDLSTDNRWLIQNITISANIGALPITLDLELRQVQPSDIIQSVDSDYDGMT